MNQIIQVLLVVVLCLTAMIQIAVAMRLLGIRVNFRNDGEKRRRLAEQHERAKAERRTAGIIESEGEK